MLVRSGAVTAVTGVADSVTTNPWQERDDIGLPRAFVQTVWAVLRKPKSFFETTRPALGLGGPLLFGVSAGLLGQMVETFFYVLASPIVSRWLPVHLPPMAPSGLGALGLAPLPGWALSFLGCQIAILAIPLLLVIIVGFLFVVAGLVHLGLKLLGALRASEAGFRGTFACTCYALGASVAQAVPVLGDLIFVVAAITIQVVGLQVVHGTTVRKALAGALGPLLLAAFVAVALAASLL